MQPNPLPAAEPRPIDLMLYQALSTRRHASAAELLAAGADPDRPVVYGGLTPLMAACQTREAHGCLLLIQAGCALEATQVSTGQTALARAAQIGAPAPLRALVEAGAELNPRDHWGRLPCHLAASFGHADCLSILLAAGSDFSSPDHSDSDGRSFTPAMSAATQGQADCLAMLIAAGADIAYADSNGDDALSYATANGHAACSAMIRAELERKELALSAGIASDGQPSPPKPRI